MDYKNALRQPRQGDSMRHKIYQTKIAICERCEEKFRKKSKLSRLCDACWNKAMKKRDTNKRNQLFRLCDVCNKKIKGNKIVISFIKRNFKVKNVKFPKAWTRRIIFSSHVECFNKRFMETR